MVRFSLDDPLAKVLAPPPNESCKEKEVRERSEAEARMISDAIDGQLRQERSALKKKKKPVKVLLLGQSESGAWLVLSSTRCPSTMVSTGKSATLKNFQLQHAREQWTEERLSWKAVIYLNLVRNVIDVLDVLAQAMAYAGGDKRPGSSGDISDSDGEHRSRSTTYTFTDHHRLLKLRLAPLRTVLADLQRRLGSGSEEVYTVTGPHPNAVGKQVVASRSHEFGVSSSNGWKSVLDKLRQSTKGEARSNLVQKRRGAEEDEVTGVLLGCREAMKCLWQDPVVKQILAHRRSRIEDSSGFFLDDIDRIASPDYQPTDGDIVRARLRTVGVQEHRFTLDADNDQEWIMYDFGGTRSSRASWASFFDDVDAIIFLSPISCFDERLREDQTVNRLEDSLQLWRSVCSSRILAKTQIVLFLNKCDILRKKMKRGVLVKTYVPSFADRTNDAITVMNYFLQHFKEISRTCSPEPRQFFVHFTSVIDTTATAATLDVVQESVLRQHLKNASLI
ncbi:hypothetical protein ID866_2779 [Astraeus odoratus]|nr:hypothetical protein ID866_2779 [Astraeus odoratus]